MFLIYGHINLKINLTDNFTAYKKIEYMPHKTTRFFLSEYAQEKNFRENILKSLYGLLKAYV